MALFVLDEIFCWLDDSVEVVAQEKLLPRAQGLRKRSTSSHTWRDLSFSAARTKLSKQALRGNL